MMFSILVLSLDFFLLDALTILHEISLNLSHTGLLYIKLPYICIEFGLLFSFWKAFHFPHSSCVKSPCLLDLHYYLPFRMEFPLLHFSDLFLGISHPLAYKPFRVSIPRQKEHYRSARCLISQSTFP